MNLSLATEYSEVSVIKVESSCPGSRALIELEYVEGQKCLNESAKHSDFPMFASPKQETCHVFWSELLSSTASSPCLLSVEVVCKLNHV